MPYQKQVNLMPAPAVQGDLATLNPTAYTATNRLAEGPVTVGRFVWPGTSPERQAKAAGTAGTAPLGIVQREYVYYNADIYSAGSLTVPENSELTIAVKGDFWVTTVTAATYGQKVFANLADGTIQTGAAGAEVEGAIETDWIVKTAGDANSLIIISNWSN